MTPGSPQLPEGPAGQPGSGTPRTRPGGARDVHRALAQLTQFICSQQAPSCELPPATTPRPAHAQPHRWQAGPPLRVTADSLPAAPVEPRAPSGWQLAPTRHVPSAPDPSISLHVDSPCSWPAPTQSIHPLHPQSKWSWPGAGPAPPAGGLGREAPHTRDPPVQRCPAGSRRTGCSEGSTLATSPPCAHTSHICGSPQPASPSRP